MRVRELEDRYPPELSNRFFDVLTLQKGLEKLLLDFPTAVIQIIFGLLLFFISQSNKNDLKIRNLFKKNCFSKRTY